MPPSSSSSAQLDPVLAEYARLARVKKRLSRSGLDCRVDKSQRPAQTWDEADPTGEVRLAWMSEEVANFDKQLAGLQQHGHIPQHLPPDHHLMVERRELAQQRNELAARQPPRCQVRRREGGGRPRGRSESSSRSAGGGSSGSDSEGESDPPEYRHADLAPFLLVGTDRLLAGSLSRIGAAVT